MSHYELRPLEEADFSTISTWLSTPKTLFTVCANLFAYPFTQEAFSDFFVLTASPAQGKLCYKYVDAKSNAIVGMISFNRMDKKNRAGHIGFVATDPEVRGKGIGGSMLEAMLKVGFEQQGFHRVSLYVLEHNPRARKFYEKVGFVNEGLQRDLIYADGAYHGCFAMSMLASDWERR